MQKETWERAGGGKELVGILWRERESWGGIRATGGRG